MKILIVCALLVLAACASEPVSTTHYLLRSGQELQSRQLNPSAEFRFGSLAVADYIDHPGLVLETGAGEIHVAQNHQWAEPLRHSLKSYLAAEVSAHVGEDILFSGGATAPTVIDIRIDQLHGGYQGEAVLVAYWRLTVSGGENLSFRFAETLPLARDGYAALADAEKALLQNLARRIAESLKPA